MPIKIACSCGKQLAAPDNLAGKRAKCPKCGEMITIPVPKAAAQAAKPAKSDDGFADLLDEMGVQASRTGIRCPECGGDVQEGAVLCVTCGFRFDKGRKISTIVLRDDETEEERDEFAGKYTPHGVAQLDQAERDMLRLQRENENLSKGFPWWGLAIIFGLLTYLIVGNMFRKPHVVLGETGLAVMGLGAAAAVWFWLVLTYVAFHENWRQGLLFFFIPLYAPFYLFTRWKFCKPAVMNIVYAAGMIGLGAFIYYVAAPMAK